MLRAVADDGAAAASGLDWIAVGELGVYVEEWQGPQEVTREGMLRHHRVVSAIHERVDCLPVRFPTWSPDPASLLLPRLESLASALRRVRGKSELAVTLVWDEPLIRPHPGPLPEGEGTAFMRQRQVYWAARREREAEAREWAGQLGPDALVKVCPNERVAVSASLLVPRGLAEPAALNLPAALPGTRCVVNGPWPPYSFATVE